jgi:RimJ/RimL family protein N-acetyltransferase
MLIKADQVARSDVRGLGILDYGLVAGGGASAAVIEVPADHREPYGYSSRCDKLYVMLEGALRFNVDGIAYVARPGDAVVVPKGELFDYFDWRGQPARMLVFHIPACDESAEHILPNVLRTHDVHLTGERVTLRPMTEDDWDCVCAWNADPGVLRWTDGPDAAPRPPEDTKWIYRSVSVFAYVFIIEFEGKPIGDIWLQKLNLPHIRECFPGRDLRRIDPEIGRKDLWAKGLGTDAIRTLLRFAFEVERADGVYADVSHDNPRSWRAFEKAGFRPLEGAEGVIVWRDNKSARTSDD